MGSRSRPAACCCWLQSCGGILPDIGLLSAETCCCPCLAWQALLLLIAQLILKAHALAGFRLLSAKQLLLLLLLLQPLAAAELHPAVIGAAPLSPGTPSDFDAQSPPQRSQEGVRAPMPIQVWSRSVSTQLGWQGSTSSCDVCCTCVSIYQVSTCSRITKVLGLPSCLPCLTSASAGIRTRAPPPGALLRGGFARWRDL